MTAEAQETAATGAPGGSATTAEAQDEADVEAAEDAEAPQARGPKGTVIVGTYDGALLGMSCTNGEQIFGYAPHIGCVKSLDCNTAGGLASGGTDNTVRLFDIARNVERGELMAHEDNVSCVRWWGTKTFISADSQGVVCIWRCAGWELLKKFRAHKAGVAALAMHHSGRLMASSGRDCGLRLWDLTRGTSAAHLCTDEVAEELVWSPDGSRLAAMGPRELLLVEVATAAVLRFRDPSSQGLTRVSLTAVAFLSGNTLLLGDGKGDVRVLEPGDSSLVEVASLPAEGRSRVKALARLEDGTFAIGTSTGQVELWRADEVGGYTRLWQVETGTRLTCIALWYKGNRRVRKRRRKA